MKKITPKEAMDLLCPDRNTQGIDTGDLRLLFADNCEIRANTVSTVEKAGDPDRPGRIRHLLHEQAEAFAPYFTTARSAVVMIETAGSFPLMMHEMQFFSEFFEKFSPATNIRWAVKTVDTEEFALKIHVAVANEEKQPQP